VHDIGGRTAAILAMEFIDGETLRRRVGGKPVPIEKY
jgi:hypothetical protein